MSMEQMFEQASRMKLRIDTNLGGISIEDLWDLPLTVTHPSRVSLDKIAIALHRQVKEIGDVTSFVEPAATDRNAETLQLSFEIVKHIIGVRVKERDEARTAADRKEKKQRLLELIARKEDEALGEKSVDELRALAESL